MSAVAQYRTYLSDYLEKNHNMKPRQFFQCINPQHTDNNPSMMFTDKYNICHCFSCGVSYDIFDVVGIDYHLDNFRDQLLKIQELYLGYVPVIKSTSNVDKKIYDYNNYFKKCIKNISKTNYLQSRGISESLIKKYGIGYDEERSLIVFPINKNCYFARSTISKDKIKSRGKSDIWNKKYRAVDYCELITPDTAEALGYYTEDFYKGYPAVLKNKYGKGTAYYIGFRDDGAFLADFYEYIIAEAGMKYVELPEGVTVHTRQSEEAIYTFVENYSETEKSVELTGEYTDMETGEVLTGLFKIDSFGIRILKSKVGMWEEKHKSPTD